MLPSVFLSAADRFALTLDGLCRAVAARVSAGVMSAMMILLVWRRVRRIEGQIQRLLVRFRLGRSLVQPAVCRRVGAGGRVGRAAGLPMRFGWLLPLVPHEAACFAGQVRTLLAEDEMVALLAAAPQARRVLAPLCRMLGIEAEVLSPEGRAGSVDAAGIGEGEPGRGEFPGAVDPPAGVTGAGLDQRWRDGGGVAFVGDG